MTKEDPVIQIPMYHWQPFRHTPVMVCTCILGHNSLGYSWVPLTQAADKGVLPVQVSPSTDVESRSRRGVTRPAQQKRKRTGVYKLV